MTSTAHRVHPEELTVYAIDEHGESHDLNADGEPCATKADLVEYICELLSQGAYDEETCDRLLAVARSI